MKKKIESNRGEGKVYIGKRDADDDKRRRGGRRRLSEMNREEKIGQVAYRKRIERKECIGLFGGIVICGNGKEMCTVPFVKTRCK